MIFFYYNSIITIAQLIISVILRCQVKSKLEDFKYIPISSVESIIFTENKTNIEYNPNTPNLGLAGELILDCYIGHCTEEITQTRYNLVGERDDDGIEDCENEPNMKKILSIINVHYNALNLNQMNVINTFLLDIIIV